MTAEARRGGWTEPDRNLRNYYCVNLDGYQKGSWWQLWTADATIVGRTGTGIISRLSRSPSKRFSGNAGLHPLSGRKSRTPLHWPIRPVLPLIGRPPRCVVAVGVERLVQVDQVNRRGIETAQDVQVVPCRYGSVAEVGHVGKSVRRV